MGKDLKEYVGKRQYLISNLCDKKIERAYDNFFHFLISKDLIRSKTEIIDDEELGLRIFDIEQKVYKKENLFHCVSQLIEMLIDLQIIEIE